VSGAREHQLVAGVLVLLNFVIAYIAALLVAIALGYFDFNFYGYSVSDVFRVAIFVPVLLGALRLRRALTPPSSREEISR
jgi:hypothetical protein